MTNKWGIPKWLEDEVRARDKKCIYCSTPFTPHKINRTSSASWEHIINDASIVTRENIALYKYFLSIASGAGWVTNYKSRRT